MIHEFRFLLLNIEQKKEKKMNESFVYKYLKNKVAAFYYEKKYFRVI